MDAHPGVLFREGPTGRRAGLAAGPDVWEVIRTLRDTRAAAPDATGPEVVDLVCENTGLDRSRVRVAMDYYGAYSDEVDALVDAADKAEAEFERASEQTRRLLGP